MRGLNLFVIGVDVYQLVKLALETGEPSYIKDLRDAANEMQKQIDLPMHIK